MSVPQTGRLLCREPFDTMISLPGRAQLVLVRAVKGAETGQDADAELGGQVDGVAGVVFWRIGGNVGPSARVLILVQHTP